jgi:hypothetical protein
MFLSGASQMYRIAMADLDSDLPASAPADLTDSPPDGGQVDLKSMTEPLLAAPPPPAPRPGRAASGPNFHPNSGS